LYVKPFLYPQISQNCKLFYFWNAEEKKFRPILLWMRGEDLGPQLFNLTKKSNYMGWKTGLRIRMRRIRTFSGLSDP
jgi:hypothetical protein